MRKNFSGLDAAIMERIGTGKRFFCDIWPAVASQANHFSSSRGGADRVVDRRLQALRKRGLLDFTDGAGWSIRAPSTIVRETK